MKRRFYLLIMSILSFCLSATGQTDTRTDVTTLSGTSDISEILVYGKEYKKPTYTPSADSPVTIKHVKTQKKNASGEWELVSSGAVVNHGTYRFQVSVVIDGENNNSYKLGTGWTLTMDGKAWNTNEVVVVYDNMSYSYAYSPEFTVEATDAPLAFYYSSRINVPFSRQHVAITPYSVADYAVGGKLPYTFSKTSGPDWLSVSADGTISGTPTVVGANDDMVVRVTDSNNDYKEITLRVSETSTTICKEVNAVSCTSGYRDIAKYGNYCVKPEFVVEDDSPVIFPYSMIGWKKKNSTTGEWETVFPDVTFTEGIYQAHVQVRIESYEYVLGEDCVFTVDGIQWEKDKTRVSDNISGFMAYSEEITVKEPKSFNQMSNYVEYMVDPKLGEAQAVALDPDCPDEAEIYLCHAVYDTENGGIGYPVTSIKEYAFSRTSKMKTITIPENVTSIGVNAFMIEQNLQEIICLSFTPPAALEEAATVTAEAGTFSQWCFDNVKLTVPAGAKDIYLAKAPWNKFKNVSTVDLPIIVVSDGLRYNISTKDDGTKIATVVGVEKLNEEMTVSETVTDPYTNNVHTVVAVGDWCFSQWYGICRVNLPKTIESIGDGAFYGISTLEWIYCYAPVPPAVKIADVANGVFGTFEDECFENVNLVVHGSAVSKVYMQTNPWYLFKKMWFHYTDEECLAMIDEETKTAEVTANPEAELSGDITIESKFYDGGGTEYTVTSIADNAFAGQDGITSIVIPETVTSLGSSVFDGCSSLREIECLATTPPAAISAASLPQSVATRSTTKETAKPTFDEECLSNARLVVPNGSIEKYRNTEPWLRFYDIVEKEPTGIESTTAPSFSFRIYGTTLNAGGKAVKVYDIIGRLVYDGSGIVSLKKGSYIIKADGRTMKIQL